MAYIRTVPHRFGLGALPAKYIVKGGDKLTTIASKVYGKALTWPGAWAIYQANQAIIDAEAKRQGKALTASGYAYNWSFPGQELVIPPKSEAQKPAPRWESNVGLKKEVAPTAVAPTPEEAVPEAAPAKKEIPWRKILLGASIAALAVGVALSVRKKKKPTVATAL